MLTGILNKLRRELTPLVRSSLRSELEPVIREELRRELRLESSTSGGGLLHVETLQKLGKDLELVIRKLATQSEQSSSQVISTDLADTVAEKVSLRINEVAEASLAALTGKMREEIEPDVRGEIKRDLCPVIELELNAEKAERLESARRGDLLEYLKRVGWCGIGSFIDELPFRMKLDAKAELKTLLSDGVMEELKREFREKALSDPRDPFRKQVLDSLMQDVRIKAVASAEMIKGASKQLVKNITSGKSDPVADKLYNQLLVDEAVIERVEQKLKSQLSIKITDELRHELEPKIRETLEREMLLPILVNSTGNIEGTVAGVLRRNLTECIDGLRDQVGDEVWRIMATAVTEAFAAVVNPFDCDEEQAFSDKLELALDTASRIYEPKNWAARDRLSAAITVALRELDLDPTESASAKWQRYLEKAREVIDDRILPKDYKSARNLQIPDGFFRAVTTHKCDFTQTTIDVGEYYLAFRGCRVGVPLTPELAEELVERTARKLWETGTDKVAPPWDGFPIGDSQVADT